MNPNSSTTHSSVPGAQDRPDLERHARKCEICHHPNREEIEEGFLLWRPGDSLARSFDVKGTKDAIYRHARALGLYEQRRRNMRYAAELLIEGAALSQPTAHDVIEAIRLHSRIDAEGQLNEPPRTQHIIVERRLEPPAQRSEIPPPADGAASNERTIEAVPLEATPAEPQPAIRRDSEAAFRRTLIASSKH
jgi:hypothetical protein